MKKVLALFLCFIFVFGTNTIVFAENYAENDIENTTEIWDRVYVEEGLESLYTDFPMIVDKEVNEFMELNIILDYVKNISENDYVKVSVNNYDNGELIEEKELQQDEKNIKLKNLSADSTYTINIEETINGNQSEYSGVIKTKYDAADFPVNMMIGGNEIQNNAGETFQNVLIKQVGIELNQSEEVDEDYSPISSIEPEQLYSFYDELEIDYFYDLQVNAVRNGVSQYYRGFISTYENGDELGVFIPSYSFGIGEPEEVLAPSISTASIDDYDFSAASEYKYYQNITKYLTYSSYKIIKWTIPEWAVYSFETIGNVDTMLTTYSIDANGDPIESTKSIYRGGGSGLNTIFWMKDDPGKEYYIVIEVNNRASIENQEGTVHFRINREDYNTSIGNDDAPNYLDIAQSNADSGNFSDYLNHHFYIDYAGDVDIFTYRSTKGDATFDFKNVEIPLRVRFFQESDPVFGDDSGVVNLWPIGSERIISPGSTIEQDITFPNNKRIYIIVGQANITNIYDNIAHRYDFDFYSPTYKDHYDVEADSTYGNVPLNATELGMDFSINDATINRADTDYYAFTPEEDGTDFNAELLPTESGLLYELRLYVDIEITDDPGNYTLGQYIAAGTEQNGNMVLSCNNLKAGHKYYLRVSSPESNTIYDSRYPYTLTTNATINPSATILNDVSLSNTKGNTLINIDAFMDIVMQNLQCKNGDTIISSDVARPEVQLYHNNNRLTASYVNNLAPGTYTISVNYKGKSATGKTISLKIEDLVPVDGLHLSYSRPFFNLTLDGHSLTDYDVMINNTHIDMNTTKLALGNSLTPRIYNIKARPQNNNTADWEELNIKICLYGDVNRDGIVNEDDALLTQSAALEKIELDDEQFILADVDGDGTLDMGDATDIQRYALGNSDTFPVGNIKIFTYDKQWSNPSRVSVRKYGDVDGDGRINMNDAGSIMQYHLEIKVPDNEQLILSDLNGDNKIDMTDANMAQDYFLEKITTFPVGDNVLFFSDSTTDPITQDLHLSYEKPFFNLTFDGQDLTNYEVMVNDTDIDISTTKLALGNSLTPRMNNIKIRPKNNDTADWEELNVKICLYGDVNRDGIVNEEDLDLTMKGVLEKIDFDDEQFILTDVDGDGELSMNDYLEIQRYILRTDYTFPVGNIKIFTYDEPWKTPSDVSLRKYGDVNGDDIINMDDSYLIQDYYLGTRYLDNEQLILANLDDNNEINMNDAGLAMSYYLGNITTFPIGDNVLFFSNRLQYIDKINTPIKITMDSNIIQVEASRNSAVALDEDGNVYTWGDGSYYDLGHGTDNSNVHYPKKVENLPKIVQVAKGKHHTLALDEDGYIWGWGNNSSGELGSDLKGKVYVPTKISGIDNVTDISAGSGFSAALSNGEVWTWGNNQYGQIGRTDDTGVPKKITGTHFEYLRIDCGENFMITTDRDPEYYEYNTGTWGRNNSGQLGIGSTIDSPHYQSLSINDPLMFSAGREHALAISGNSVYAWGRNSVGQLGLGDKNNRTTPTEIPNFENIKFVEAAYGHSMAIAEDGTLYTWGEGRDGQMGNGKYETSRVPVKVDAIKNAKSATGGNNFTIVLDENGDMWSFGDNEFGQLGVGKYNNFGHTETQKDGFLPPASEREPLWSSSLTWWQYDPNDETDLYAVCYFSLQESRVICKGKSYNVPQGGFEYHVIFYNFDYDKNSNYELCVKVYYDDRAEYYLDPGERIEKGYSEGEIAYFNDYALVPIMKVYSDNNGQMFEVE